MKNAYSHFHTRSQGRQARQDNFLKHCEAKSLLTPSLRQGGDLSSCDMSHSPEGSVLSYHLRSVCVWGGDGCGREPTASPHVRCGDALQKMTQKRFHPCFCPPSFSLSLYKISNVEYL